MCAVNFNTPLTTLDFVVLGAYAALILGVGLFMGRFVKSSGDFFSGGKKVPWWMGAISSYMAMISSFVFIAHGGVAYSDGVVAIVVFWSCAFAVLAGTWVFASRWRRARVDTPMEYLERRYGAWVRQFISWCGVAFRILDNMVRLYTLGLMASVLTGVDVETGIWLGCAVVLVYTLAGGLWSVIVTDVIQCAILLGVSVAVLPLALHAVGGLGVLRTALPDHFDPFNGHRGEFLFLAAYYAMVFIKYNANWAFIQRLASVPTAGDAKKMSLLTAGLFFVFPVVALLPAICARQLMPGINPEESYIRLCGQILPSGAMGLMVSAMLAATLSTLASEFNVTSSVLAKDIYERLWRPNASEREKLVFARLSTLGVAALVAFGASYVKALGGAFEANKTLMGLVGVPIVIPSVFGILWKRPNSKGVVLCVVFGVGFGVAGLFIDSLSWQAKTLAQMAVAFAGYFAGCLFKTSEKERKSKEELFAEVNFNAEAQSRREVEG
jgi:SSS family transporter